MKYKFTELVDIPRLQELTDNLYKSSFIPSAIIDMEGVVLTESGWQRICTDFHRRHPEIEKECIKSDVSIHDRLAAGESFAMYKCPRGLLDASSPVLIDGEHVANVFVGQLFTEPPDASTENFFREQARKFGFDEPEYIKAFQEVPVYPVEKFRDVLRFLSNLVKLVVDIGLARKKELDAMATLRYFNELMQYIISHAQSAIAVHDRDMKYIYVSDQYLLQYNVKEKDVIGKHHYDVFPDLPQKWRDVHQRVLAGAVEGKDEDPYVREDGSVDWTRWECRPWYESDGSIGGLIVYTEVITERVEEKEKIRRALKEKEVMLQEIHHRVKNNMQIIYSLLNLQAKGIEDSAVRAMFEESRNRINSMALIHEKLYRSKDLAHVDFKEYLKSLVAGIAETYKRSDVVLSVEMEPICLDVNVGIPCGLIVNELVSNSFKYAFPVKRNDEKTGTIKVEIVKKDEANFVLSVADDGVGFSAGVDLGNPATLGLQLVNVLVKQIYGTIELSRTKGTRFSVTFPTTREERVDGNG